MRNVFPKILLGGFFILIAGASLFPYHNLLSHWLWTHTHLADASFFLNSRDPQFAFEIGHYSFNHGGYDLEQAKKYFEKAIELNPNYLDAHYQLARIHFLNGKFNLALAEIERVIDLNPEFKKAYYMKGLILGYQSNLIDAIPAFEEFIKRDSFNWAGYNDLAWIHFQLGHYEKTRDVALRGLEQSPRNAWLLNMEGLALFNLGRKEDAKSFFEKAKREADSMKPEDWGIAYPGNDPAIYDEGLARMREAIGKNLTLVETGT